MACKERHNLCMNRALLDRVPRNRATLYKVWQCKVMESDVCLILNFNRKKVESIILDHYMYFFKMKRGIVHVRIQDVGRNRLICLQTHALVFGDLSTHLEQSV